MPERPAQRPERAEVQEPEPELAKELLVQVEVPALQPELVQEPELALPAEQREPAL